MKYFFTILAALTISSLSYSQITWDQATADTARGWETTDDIKTHNVITLTKAGTYRWVRTYNKSCSVMSAICDKNQCYLETTDSAEFTVAANESFDMICHFYPNGKCCPEGAVVTLKVFKVDEPTISSTATYVLDIWCESLSVENSDKELFEIAPNPATDMIHILNINKIDNVTISNVLGETVVNEEKSTGHVDVSALKSGIYWITVKSDKSTVTKRFIKE